MHAAADVLGLDDAVFDLAITPDRGYCLSVRGMAREIANAYDLDYVDPADVAPLPADGEALPVTIEPGTGVLRFGLRPVTGIDPQRRCRRGGCSDGCCSAASARSRPPST